MKRMAFATLLFACLMSCAAYCTDTGGVNTDFQSWAGKKVFQNHAINARGTLSGNVTLGVNDSPYQSADPNGSDRTITLPNNDNLGMNFWIFNVGSANNLLVKNSGGTTIVTVQTGQMGFVSCTGGAWSGAVFSGASTTGFLASDGSVTGATAQTQMFTNGVNKVTITAPATGSTLTIADGKTFTCNNTLTLAGTNGTTMTFPTTSATLARTDAANTFTGHQTIEGVTSTGATGTGQLVFDTSPTLTTPTIGAATATTVNKVTITAPAASATLTIANGKTATVNNTLTLAGTDSTTMTFPPTSATIARTDAANTFTGDQTFSGSIIGTGTVSPTAFSGSANDLAIGTGVLQVRVTTNNAGSQNLTGMANGTAGRVVFITNIGNTDSIVIKHDVTSTAANRFYCANNADVTLRVRGTVMAIYDGTLTRWMIVGP